MKNGETIRTAAMVGLLCVCAVGGLLYVWPAAAQSAADGLDGLLDPVNPAAIVLPVPPAPQPATSRPAPDAATDNPASTTAPFSAPSSAPIPAGLTDSEQLFVRILDARVANLVSLMRDDEDGQAARRSLLSLHDAFATALLQCHDQASPEARARLADTLEQCARKTREELVLSELTPAQRDKLQSFRATHPRLVVEAIGEDLDRRAAAVVALLTLNDPDQAAEPLLLLALRSPRPEPQLAAMKVLAKKRYRGDDLVDAVTDLAVAEGESAYYIYNRAMYYHAVDNLEQTPGVQARSLLREWKPARATPRLIAALRGNADMPSGHAVELLVDIADPRSIPATFKLLESASASVQAMNSTRESWHNENTRRTVGRSRTDALLDLFLRLTNQSPAAYGMESLSGDYGRLYEIHGFSKPTDRAQAVAQAKQWYATHKARYADLPAIPPPPKPAAVRATRWPGPPTASDETSPNADLLDVSALTAEIARTVTRLAADLDGPRPAARARAQERLIALHDRIADPLFQTGPDPVGRYLLRNMAALCEGVSYAVTLDRPLRDKLLSFRERNDELFRQFFFLNNTSQQQALTALRTKDNATGAAEAMVILGLASRSSPVREAACALAATGRYHGERVIDLLCERVAGTDTSVELGAVKALAKIASPRTSPLLLGRATAKDLSPHDSRFIAYLDALIATGDLRLVPALLERLNVDGDHRRISWNVSGREISTYVSDGYLYVLLQLTGQQVKDYDLRPYSNSSSRGTPIPPGFYSDKARTAAYAKARKWWEDNKDKPPYKDLDPLPISPSTAPRRTGPVSDFDNGVFFQE